MGKPTRRKKRKASSGSNSDTLPKQETKHNNLGEVSFLAKLIMVAQIEQDETSSSSSDMWKVLMRIEDNTNSLINDFKALQHNYNVLRASLEFSQAKIDDLSTSNSALQTKMESMEKNNFVLETKLQESLMKNALLEEKIHELNTKHNDLKQ